MVKEEIRDVCSFDIKQLNNEGCSSYWTKLSKRA